MKTGIERVPGIGPQSAKVLMKSGFDTISSLANATVDQLSAVPGFGTVRAEKVIRSAAALVAERPSEDAPGGAGVETTSQASGQGNATAEIVADETGPEKKHKTKKKKKKKKKRNDPVAVWAAYKRAARKLNPSQ